MSVRTFFWLGTAVRKNMTAPVSRICLICCRYFTLPTQP
nr:MAG TPA: hypothetical protein [Caudoviricetes sp.]